jgi:hypothetical protein
MDRSMMRGCALAALVGAVVAFAPASASAHTTQICWRDSGGVTTFYAGSYHQPWEGPSPVGKIIVDGFGYPFSGYVVPSQLPADVQCWGCPGSWPAVVHYQTFTSGFSAGAHTISFDSTTAVQSPWCTFPQLTFGGGACNDADFDGICNDDDACPLDAANDGDNDGRCANVDNCPNNYNPTQTDANGNGQGDACEGDVCGNGLVTGSEQCDDGNKAGGDGTADGCDPCPNDATNDSDGDGACDSADPCPTDNPDDSDGDTICDSLDVCAGGDDLADQDSDGIADHCDACPLDIANDADGDGVCGNLDSCPGGDDGIDADGDGAADFCDVCPIDFYNDSDGDGACDSDDICPFDNPDDSDGDGVCNSSDVCKLGDDNLDTDSDGTADACDACPNDAANDADGDGLCESSDNCPTLANANQSDVDADGIGDACEPDNDDDGVIDDYDNCPLDVNADQVDTDSDGLGDVCDSDDDGDGVADGNDVCLGTPAGEPVLANGCSPDQECPCDNGWKNHGGYVKCMAHATNALVAAGTITETEKGAIMSEAGSSTCGHKKK